MQYSAVHDIPNENLITGNEVWRIITEPYAGSSVTTAWHSAGDSCWSEFAAYLEEDLYEERETKRSM